MTDEVRENTTLHLGRIPTTLTTQELEDALEDCGPMKRCFVVSKKGNNAKGKTSPFTTGYAQFAFKEDAEKCLKENKEGLQLQHAGQLCSLSVSWAEEKRDKMKRREPEGIAPDETASTSEPFQYGGKSDEQRKVDVRLAKEKKARLIVRNLSFKAEEMDLQEHFEQCGEVKEVKILKKPDGKKVGCAFVQFADVASAADAIKKLNRKPLMGRPVAVDWAVAKDQYQRDNVPAVKEEVKPEIKEEEAELDASEVKDEPESSDDEEDEEMEEGDDDDEEVSDSDEDEDESSDKKKGDFGGGFGGDKAPHNLKTGHDISENRTVFLRNLSFDSEEVDLRDMMRETFGPVLFARLVLDRETEHPKGTAFVKFTAPDAVDKVVAASLSKDGLWLDERQIYAVKAMTKDDADEQKRKKHEKEAKDNRNLHLAVEGLIRPGTGAASGVSKTDMEKRQKVEKWKRNVLKDLSMFISPNRLCVRNLPDNASDASLKRIFLACLDDKKSAKILECKVIRDFHSKAGPAQQGKSKGYAFVSFENHEHALEALRKLNNNPKTFTKDMRPMVEFSVENKKAVNARVNRLEKSRQNNPNKGGGKGLNLKKGPQAKDNKDNSVGPAEQKTSDFKRKPTKERLDPDSKPQYMGSINDPKQRNLAPSHAGPKIRHVKREPEKGVKAITRKSLKKGNSDKLRKLKKLNVTQKEVFTGGVPENAEPKKQKKEKKGKKGKKFSVADTKDFREEKQFSALVDKYRNKLSGAGAGNKMETKKKWFNE